MTQHWRFFLHLTGQLNRLALERQRKSQSELKLLLDEAATRQKKISIQCILP